METPEVLKRKIGSTEDLQSVVKTMKGMAAVNIREYERAVEALVDYYRTVEMGLNMVLRYGGGTPVTARYAPIGRTVAIVVGSDLGMCGPFNEQIVGYAVEYLRERHADEHGLTLLAVGEKTASQLMHHDYPMPELYQVPAGIQGITPLVQELLVKLERLEAETDLSRAVVFHGYHKSHAAYEPRAVELLPVDKAWLESIQQRRGESRTLPMFTMDRSVLFSFLIRQYLFIELYRAIAESLASENAARLIAMQGAEKNIEERLGELTQRYHQQRQTSITQELLEVVSGFEALKKGRRR